MKSLGELRKEKGVLVAAHRGTSGGNIPPNTIAAFDLALKEGQISWRWIYLKAWMGEIFVFHTGTEPAYLDRHIRIESRTSEEIRNLRLCNCDLEKPS